MKNIQTIFILCSIFLSQSFLVTAQKEKKVSIETNYGKIIVKLYNETPVHRDNFLKLVKDGFYDGLLFHRVIKNFMIQGGDPDSKNAKPGTFLGDGSPGYDLPAEIIPKYFHKHGALAAARLGDAQNPTRRSSGSQFYIVEGKKYTKEQLEAFEKSFYTKLSEPQIKAYTTVGGTPNLDAQYTVFGEVVKGMEVVLKIASVKKDKNDRPVKDAKILKMKILN